MPEEIKDEEERVSVEDSILNSVKKLLGIESDYTEFDIDIMMNINAAISTLRQLGVGPNEGFVVTSENDTYDDFLGPDCKETSQVKIYLFYKTRIGFDPPQSSIVMSAMEKMIQEAEWRLNVQVDSRKTFSGNRGEIS